MPRKKISKNTEIAKEPNIPYGDTPLSFEKVWLLFQESDRKMQENERKMHETMQETERKMQETDRKMRESDRELKELISNISKELGGIGKSNGQLAEDFFYTALDASLKVGNFKFDFIDRNLHRKRKNLEGQYDIVLYNDHKVLIVEVKYNFKRTYLQEFYKGIKNFRSLYPEYAHYKLYGAVAGMTFEPDAMADAKEYGFFILTQNNQVIKIENGNDFKPSEIK